MPLFPTIQRIGLEDAEFTPTELADCVAGTTAETIRQWLHRNIFSPVSLEGQGRGKRRLLAPADGCQLAVLVAITRNGISAGHAPAAWRLAKERLPHVLAARPGEEEQALLVWTEQPGDVLRGQTLRSSGNGWSGVPDAGVLLRVDAILRNALGGMEAFLLPHYREPATALDIVAQTRGLAQFGTQFADTVRYVEDRHGRQRLAGLTVAETRIVEGPGPGRVSTADELASRQRLLHVHQDALMSRIAGLLMPRTQCD